MKVKKKAGQPSIKVGPRITFFHYINDLNMNLEEAVQKILKDFTSLNEDIIKSWYYEEQSKRNSEGKEIDDNGGR